MKQSRMEAQSVDKEQQKAFPYFDMHLHILPGIDDGSRNIGETRKMLAMEWEQGVRCLCATPHFSVGCQKVKADFLEVYWKVSEMMREDFPDMRLYMGQEIFYAPGAISALSKKEALSLNGSRYVLVEFHPEEAYANVYHSLQELGREGYIPVLAHVERLSCLWRNRERLDELKAMYIPFQMNTSSLTGARFDPALRYCRKLVSQGYIDLLGTDAHGSIYRPPDYKAAACWIEEYCGKEALYRMAFQNPAAILNDELLKT